MPNSDFVVHVGPWVWPAFATAFAIVVTWFCLDDRPTTGYGHIGQGLGNLIILLCCAVVILCAWIVYLLLRP